MKQRAVIYARYSSDKQTEQSIDGQLRACREYAERFEYEIVGEYIDRAKSGTSDRRENFQRMIKDSKLHGFDVILVWKLDRFARNRYDSAIYKRDLKRNGVRVVSVTEAVGEGDENIILEAVLEAMAETYSRQLSQNVRRGMMESARKCKSTGGTIPFGYQLNDGNLEIDPQRADYVRYIFERYAAGDSPAEIVRHLNAAGARSRSGKPLTYNSIGYVIKNKKYIGIYHYEDLEVVGGCPAIIDADLFERCRIRREKNRRAPAAKKAQVDYLLVGKAFCGYCGEPLIADSGRSKTGTVYHYYACRKVKKKQCYCETCRKKRESLEDLERFAVEATVRKLTEPGTLEAIAEQIARLYNADISDDRLHELEQRHAELQRELDAAADALIHARGQRLIDRINEQADHLDAQLSDVEEQLNDLRRLSRRRLDPSDVAAWLRQFCDGDLNDPAYRRRIIETLIHTVYVFDPGEDSIIYFNVAGANEHTAPRPSLADSLTTAPRSNLNGDGSPRPPKFELFYLEGVFGFWAQR